jgi:hypothetical protein
MYESRLPFIGALERRTWPIPVVGREYMTVTFEVGSATISSLHTSNLHSKYT